jgi:hypothetical protein
MQLKAIDKVILMRDQERITKTELNDLLEHLKANE